MMLSNDANKLRQIIENAIEDHKISRTEYERIIHQAVDDEHIDRQEWALLRELQKMIADKSITITP